MLPPIRQAHYRVKHTDCTSPPIRVNQQDHLAITASGAKLVSKSAKSGARVVICTLQFSFYKVDQSTMANKPKLDELEMMSMEPIDQKPEDQGLNCMRRAPLDESSL